MKGRFDRHRHNRILLKVSGECFAREALLESVVGQAVEARKMGVVVAVVVGGGNILRGRQVLGLDRVAADNAGMLATVINGTRLTEALRAQVPVSHLSARELPGVVRGYDAGLARDLLNSGKVLVLSGGTSNPFFSTDSAAALRAAELGLSPILKATNVAGVYSADPKADKSARLLRRLSFQAALAKKLAVMDLTAFAFCMEHSIPIIVFDVTRPNAIVDIIKGKPIGSLVC